MEEKMAFDELQQMVSICLDEIIQLKQEKEQLQQKNQGLEQLMAQLIDGQKQVISSVNQCFDNIDTNRHFVNRAIDNVKYEHMGEIIGEDYYSPSFYNYSETIDGIVKEGKSLVRFGDGEFDLMAGRSRHKFQHYDEILSRRLQEIIQLQEARLMVAVADNYGSLEKYNEDGKQGIRSYMTKEVRMEHRKWLDLNRTYHNSYITRPYALFADNHTQAPLERFRQLQRIWEGRKVIFVEGNQSRLGVENDLFDNAASIRRIEAPATSSFDRYDEILNAALNYAEKDTLFLVALGPTAEVLVYDLFKNGYQAVDIGHVDLEYEWYLNGSGGRCEVKTKYNNEMIGGNIVAEICDKKFEQEIICRIG